VKLARAKKDVSYQVLISDNADASQVQDIVVGTKSLTDVAKHSEIVSLFMDDEELAESVAKRKQAEAHGYVAPSINASRPRSAFGDGLGIQDDDEDDFFSLAKQPANNEDEDFGDESKVKAASGGVEGEAPKKKKSSGGSKRKAPPPTEGEWIVWASCGTIRLISIGEEKAKKPQKKKVKIALGPDGLPI
jgi:DNA helicase INO80